MAAQQIEEEKLPDKLNLRIWAKIGRYAFANWPMLIVIVLTMLVTTFYDSSFVPTMNAAAIAAVGDYATLSGAPSVWESVIHVTFISGAWEVNMSFTVFLIVEVAMILLRSLSIYWTFYLTNYIDMKIMTSLRRDTFHRVQELSFSYFDKTNSGWLIARMNNDTSSIGDVLSWDIISMFWALFDMFFTLVTMFTHDWRLALIVLASVPVVAIIVPIFEKALLKRWRTARNAYSHFVGWLAEAINGAKTIKTLSIEDEVSDEAKGIVDDIQDKRWKAGRMNAFFQPLVSFISMVMIAVVVLVGINMMADVSTLPEKERIATTATRHRLNRSLHRLRPADLRSASATLRSLLRFHGFPSRRGKGRSVARCQGRSVQDKSEVITKYGTVFNPKKENYEKLEGTLDFKEVTFGYGNGVEVIHPLTLHVEKGTSLAIVGETGSGKTTMVNLLCRFYEPTTGEIDIDGVNYLDRSLGYLHSATSATSSNNPSFSRAPIRTTSAMANSTPPTRRSSPPPSWSASTTSSWPKKKATTPSLKMAAARSPKAKNN
jgi:ATP-binding cassette subfamily B protein